jgi:GDPmannose 4,6-dehydratase
VIVVIGAAGQDGRILCEQLGAPRPRGDGTDVVAIDRGDLDLLDRGAVRERLRGASEVYYLAAEHGSSEDGNEDVSKLMAASYDVHVAGLVHVLEALGGGRLFYAASSHVFGRPDAPMQNELTPRRPINVYGMTKALGMDVVRYYRDRGVHASAGILYNHESPYRRGNFVSTRLVQGARRAAEARARGEHVSVEVGILDAVVDWGWAPDYTEAMQRIVAGEPDDFVVATGEAHTVADFARVAFEAVGLDFRAHVVARADLVRKPTVPLVGDATKLRTRTGWRPSVSFETMVGRLVRGAFA